MHIPPLETQGHLDAQQGWTPALYFRPHYYLLWIVPSAGYCVSASDPTLGFRRSWNAKWQVCINAAKMVGSFSVGRVCREGGRTNYVGDGHPWWPQRTLSRVCNLKPNYSRSKCGTGFKKSVGRPNPDLRASVSTPLQDHWLIFWWFTKHDRKTVRLATFRREFEDVLRYLACPSHIE